jgi:hypothetical protein
MFKECQNSAKLWATNLLLKVVASGSAKEIPAPLLSWPPPRRYVSRAFLG